MKTQQIENSNDALALEKIKKARTSLVVSRPFFSALLMHVDQKPSSRVPRMAVDGKSIYYNSSYVAKLTNEQLMSDLSANVVSCALLHHTRREWRDPELYDKASDAIVNPILKEAGFELPPNAFTDPDVTSSMSVEQAYSIIMKKQKRGNKDNNGNQNSSGGPGNQPGDGENDPQSNPPNSGGSSQVLAPPSMGEDGEGEDSAARSEQERDWTQAATQAATIAEGCGNVPESMRRLIDQNKEARTDWQTILKRFFEETEKTDYQWLPPNKRYVHMGEFLPSYKKEGYGEICIAVDTSGSINMELLAQFCAEINYIVQDLKPSRVIVISCDTAVGSVQEFKQGEYVEMNFVGGGGTSFIPPFRYLEKEGIKPKCMIYLTDLYCDSYPEEPDFPVLWATDTKHSLAPWGETILMPNE